jgi:Outer membrane cytochrome MtrC/MtrF-like, domains II/IV
MITDKRLIVICLSFIHLCSSVAGQRRPAIDYSKFSHTTQKHKAACVTCHRIPTTNWSKGSSFPDITDYPSHDACVSCHRPQFFRGARPQICSGCHSKPSPRDDARFVFRNPASKLQFTIEFPHDRHQDVIAMLRFAHPAPQNYNNCTICHAPRTTTFKAAPTDHSACFNCHWKSQQPVADNCNGCHKLTTPYSAKEMTVRISSKFIHDGGGERKQHVAECTTCHINITKAASLRGLRPDVPITACTECHNKDGLRQDLSKELAALDKNRSFTCAYCHTADVGIKDPPASHYLIAERTPIKRKDIK